MMPIILQLIYSVWLVAVAYINSGWIKQRFSIRHFFNGLSFLCAAWIMWSNFGWQYAVATLFLTRAVYDAVLNKLRALPLDYVSPSPKSLVDIIEKKIFKSNGWLPKVICLLVAVLLNALSYAAN